MHTQDRAARMIVFVVIGLVFVVFASVANDTMPRFVFACIFVGAFAMAFGDFTHLKD